MALGPGDVALARGPDPYRLADPPQADPTVVIRPGDRCETLTGEPLAQALRHGVRSWGTDADGGDVMLVGTYHAVGEVSGRVLGALPPILAVRADGPVDPLLHLLEVELADDEPGQAAVLDRLLDLVLVATLRRWFARPGSEAPRWYRARTDPLVGAALDLIHHDPARRWTVASLAAEVGLSRAAFARRFTALVGEPPMAYLTSWRLSLAADRLRRPGTTLAAVAAEVGYATPFALSAAFKRVRGVSPSQHRRLTVG